MTKIIQRRLSLTELKKLLIQIKHIINNFITEATEVTVSSRFTHSQVDHFPR